MTLIVIIFGFSSIKPVLQLNQQHTWKSPWSTPFLVSQNLYLVVLWLLLRVLQSSNKLPDLINLLRRIVTARQVHFIVYSGQSKFKSIQKTALRTKIKTCPVRKYYTSIIEINPNLTYIFRVYCVGKYLFARPKSSCDVRKCAYHVTEQLAQSCFQLTVF